MPVRGEARAVSIDDESLRTLQAAGVFERVLPDLVYGDSMTLWSGSREIRLFSVTGDASGSTVMYLPAEHLLVTGDALVSPEDGRGPPPWTTTNYAITPWIESLRRLDALDVATIVPGQGPAMHDKAYLERTIRLFAAVRAQARAALQRGLVKSADIEAAVDVDEIGREFMMDGAAPGPDFHHWVASLARKAAQEATDAALRLPPQP